MCDCSKILPTAAECENILQQRQGKKKNLMAHSRLVARLAEKIGKDVKQAGCEQNLALLFAAGYLHDIAKGQPGHAEAGAAILRQLGYPELAAVVELHMDVILSADDQLTAAEVVYLADKLTEGGKLAGLARRFEAVAEKYPHDMEAQRNIASRLRKAQKIQAKVEKITGKQIKEIMAAIELI